MSVEAPPPKRPPAPPVEPIADESLIDERLEQTRHQLRAVDVAGALLILTIGLISYLFAVALADHWLIPGGLGTLGRYAAWLVLLVVGGSYFWLRILRPLLRRINPVFVAQTIEQSRPTLKNSLINFLLLRDQRQPVPAVVSQQIEKQTANQLVDVSADSVVDHNYLIRLCYVLVAVLLVGGIYQVASPKNPLTSAFRVLMPFSSVEAPTRVRFDDIKPGDVVAFHGENITVSAEVDGLRDDETPMVYYSTADGQSVDQAVPMTVPEDGYRHEAKLPPESAGLQQDLTYYLAAGDYRSPVFTVTVQTAPTIHVESVQYDYPGYTGLDRRTVQGEGNLRALEGTRITIHAQTNVPIDHAEIDLGCRGLRGVPMTGGEQQVEGSFTLRFDRDDPTRPQYDGYQLRFTDKSGNESRRPIRYKIEVVADLPPRVELVDPPEHRIQLPVNGDLPLTVQAEDPDFALREVALRAVHNERSLAIRPLLQAAAPSPAHQGVFERTYHFKPAELNLKPGDEVLYWAEARDSKTPLAGQSETPRRWITIVEADPNQPEEQPQDGQPNDNNQNDQKDTPSGENQQTNQGDQDHGPKDQQPDKGPQQPNEQPSDASSSDNEQNEEESPDKQPPGDNSQTGQDDQPPSGEESTDDGEQNKEGQEGQQDSTGQDKNEDGQPDGQDKEQPSEQPSEPIDGHTNPGDVIQKALEQREKEQKEEGQQQEGQQQEGQQQEGQQQEGQQQEGQQQEGQQQEGQQQEGQQQEGQQQEGQQQEGQQQEGQQQEGQQQEGQQQEGQQQEGQQQEGQQQEGQQQEGQQQEGQQQEGQKQEGQKQEGQQQEGQQEGQQQGSQQEEGQQQGIQKQGGQQQGGQQKEGQQQGGQQKEGQQQGGQKQGSQQQGGQKQGESGQQDAGGRAGEGGQSKSDEDGRALRPDEIDPGMNVKPEGYTDKEANAQAKASRSAGPGGGGQPGGSDSPPEGEEAPEDPFNRKFAEKQTIMALEYLKEQLAKDKPDQELLDSLGGWTREDLEKFTKRWQAMFNRTKQPGTEGAKARTELDEALKSLGLHRGRTELKSGSTKDQIHRLRTPRRIKAPAEWEDQIRAYNRAIGRDESAGGGQ